MFALKERGKALENIYFNEEYVTFRLHAMRNKLVGLWAAALMKIENADAYASELAGCAVNGNEEEAVFLKLQADFQQAAVTVADDEIHDRMRDLLNSAAQSLRQGLAEPDMKAVA
ncbi:ATPase inhibitor subunit zeta [Agrobacterium sp. BA1120]|uniref:ATPase inhibitor subunit zeta n=1 Tax=Agrobacterium sp. BA1120 TaxID=3228927 RepID=UPI00336A00FA